MQKDKRRKCGVCRGRFDDDQIVQWLKAHKKTVLSGSGIWNLIFQMQTQQCTVFWMNMSEKLDCHLTKKWTNFKNWQKVLEPDVSL